MLGSCDPWGFRGSSVDLLLFPGGGRDGAVRIHNELGAPHHHGQEEEAHEHHKGHGKALVHVDCWQHRGVLHVGGPQVHGPEHPAATGMPVGRRRVGFTGAEGFAGQGKD